MKPSSLYTLFLLLFTSYSAMAQELSEVLDLRKHKIVIQFNQSDSTAQAGLIHQLDYVKTSWPNALIEVVCLNEGLDLLIISNSKVPDAVAGWFAKGVVFAACNSSMRFRNVRRSDLLPNVKVVPSAPVEVAFKQEQGWSFFRGGE